MNDENDELDVNKKNREDYENLIRESSTKKDAYWDSNNPIVKLFLLIVGIIIIVGVAYFMYRYISR